MNLAERFLQEGARSIDHDARVVHSAVPIDIPARCTISVHRLTARTDRVQVVNLRLEAGSLQVNGARGPALRLRADTAPERVTLIASADEPTTLWVWNGWIDQGLPQAWVGEAAIEHDLDGDRHTLRCSDGLDHPSFDDLVGSVVVRGVEQGS